MEVCCSAAWLVFLLWSMGHHTDSNNPQQHISQVDMCAKLIHTASRDEQVTAACVSTLEKYIKNILENETEEKYRKIRLNNKAFQVSEVRHEREECAHARTHTQSNKRITTGKSCTCDWRSGVSESTRI
jgi:hypothetical protein